jgi:hypothetical protein
MPSAIICCFLNLISFFLVWTLLQETEISYSIKCFFLISKNKYERFMTAAQMQLLDFCNLPFSLDFGWANSVEKTTSAFIDLFFLLLVCSFVCSFVRLFVCSFVRLFVCSFVRLFVCLFVLREKRANVRNCFCF